MVLELPSANADVAIITDMHLTTKNIRSIPGSVKESLEIQKTIIKELQKQEYPAVIQLGDLYHHSSSSFDDGYRLTDFPMQLHNITKGKYFSIVGNHELSYKNNNPFWKIATSFSDYIMDVKSINPAIKIFDYLRIGRVMFVAGHYGVLLNREIPDLDKIDDVYLCSHNAILEDQITDALLENGMANNVRYLNSRGIFDGGLVPDTEKLRGIFLGHMHTAHGKFCIREENKEFFMHYLGALGRTSVTDFTSDLEREVPIIHIREGVVTSIDYLTITLSERHASVDEKVVKDNRQKYENQKKRNEIRELDVNPDNDLMETIQEYLEEKDPDALKMLISISQEMMSRDLIDVLKKYEV